MQRGILPSEDSAALLSEENAPKVLMVAPLLPPEYAGGGAQAMALAARLVKHGIQVTGLAGTNTEGPASIYMRTLGSIPTYRVYRQKGSGAIRNIIYLFRFVALLLRLVPSHDIIHFHGIRLYPFLGLPIAKLFGKKTIGKISLMGTDDPVTLSGGTIGPLRKAILRVLDVWIALTHEARETCLRVGVEENRIRRIPNGVDCNRFSPLSEAEKQRTKRELGFSGRLLVVFAGLICYRKGVDLLLDAIPKVVSANPRATFVFLGPSTKKENVQVDEDISRALREMPHDAVQVLGFVDNPLKIIRSADVFVLPSRKEGLSNVLLEAMSSGLPVVVTDHPWLEDIGSNREHYMEFSSGDWTELAETISSLIHDPQLRESLGRQARSRIEEGFCLSVIARRYADLYKHLAS